MGGAPTFCSLAPDWLVDVCILLPAFFISLVLVPSHSLQEAVSGQLSLPLSALHSCPCLAGSVSSSDRWLSGSVVSGSWFPKEVAVWRATRNCSGSTRC